LNLLIEIPFALYVCTGPLLLTSVILFGIVIVKQIKKEKKQKERDGFSRLFLFAMSIVFSNSDAPVQPNKHHHLFKNSDANLSYHKSVRSKRATKKRNNKNYCWILKFYQRNKIKLLIVRFFTSRGIFIVKPK